MKRGSTYLEELKVEWKDFFVFMISVGKNFNEVTDYLTKLEGVRQDNQAKALLRNPKI